MRFLKNLPKKEDSPLCHHFPSSLRSWSNSPGLKFLLLGNIHSALGAFLRLRLRIFQMGI